MGAKGDPDGRARFPTGVSFICPTPAVLHLTSQRTIVLMKMHRTYTTFLNVDSTVFDGIHCRAVFVMQL